MEMLSGFGSYLRHKAWEPEFKRTEGYDPGCE